MTVEPKPSIKDVGSERLAAWLREQGQPAFRAKQIREWLYPKWCTDFTEMTNLPATLRAELAVAFEAFTVSADETVRGTDETEKFLLALPDGNRIESVLIRAPGRETVCISTQVGCPVRCVFCASGRGGLVRDLTAGEIVDQVIFACRALGHRVNNIVVMGIGEPLLNLGNLIPALDAICAADGLGVGARHVTVSTSGIVPGIRRLAEVARPWNLALSLHSPTDAGRSKVIPPRHRYPLVDVLAACDEYARLSGRMVTLEYTMIAGRNDSRDDLARLAQIARRLRAKVNLIPYNRTGEGICAPPAEGVAAFLDELCAGGVQATVRREKGAEIGAACGQLRARACPADGGAVG